MATRATKGGASASPDRPRTWEEAAVKSHAEWTAKKGTHGEEGEPVRLVSPGCGEGCDPCYRACAVRGVLARTLANAAVRASQRAARPIPEPFTHNGITYAETMGRA